MYQDLTEISSYTRNWYCVQTHIPQGGMTLLHNVSKAHQVASPGKPLHSISRQLQSSIASVRQTSITLVAIDLALGTIRLDLSDCQGIDLIARRRTRARQDISDSVGSSPFDHRRRGSRPRRAENHGVTNLVFRGAVEHTVIGGVAVITGGVSLLVGADLVVAVAGVRGAGTGDEVVVDDVVGKVARGVCLHV